MKFSLTFKTPDVIDAAVDDVERYSETAMCDFACECCPACHAHMLIKNQSQIIREFSKQFVQYGEYITIDFDTVAQTATVRKLK